MVIEDIIDDPKPAISRGDHNENKELCSRFFRQNSEYPKLRLNCFHVLNTASGLNGTIGEVLPLTGADADATKFDTHCPSPYEDIANQCINDC